MTQNVKGNTKPMNECMAEMIETNKVESFKKHKKPDPFDEGMDKSANEIMRRRKLTDNEQHRFS